MVSTRRMSSLSRVMNKFFGGAGPVMHPMHISEPVFLGPYPKTLVVGDMQILVFLDNSDGSSYLTG